MEPFDDSEVPTALIALAGVAFGLLLALAIRWIDGALVAVIFIPAVMTIGWAARHLLGPKL